MQILQNNLILSFVYILSFSRLLRARYLVRKPFFLLFYFSILSYFYIIVFVPKIILKMTSYRLFIVQIKYASNHRPFVPFSIISTLLSISHSVLLPWAA